MNSIVRPTSAHIPDALATEQEHKDLLSAITQESMSLNVQAIARACHIQSQVLTQEFKGCTLDQALAVILTVAANQTASLIMQIEAAAPVSDPVRDGRVKAPAEFFGTLLAQAVRERANVAKLDAVAGQRIAQMFGPKQ